MILVVVGIHIYFLHEAGRNNPLGVELLSDKVPFHVYFTSKDIVGFLIFGFIFSVVVLVYPNVFYSPDNWLPADPMSTPKHIEPEWYFLFAYAILRAIPNKVGGVIALVCAVLAPLVLSIFSWRNRPVPISRRMNPVGGGLFWLFVTRFILLT